jgi:hypothetical protein
MSPVSFGGLPPVFLNLRYYTKVNSVKPQPIYSVETGRQTGREGTVWMLRQRQKSSSPLGVQPLFSDSPIRGLALYNLLL